MSLQTIAQSQPSLKNTITTTDTTADGRVFYADLTYVKSLDKWMLRTDQVGIKIIREIHEKNKKSKAYADSLKSIVESKQIIIDACEEKVKEKDNDIADYKTQLEKKQEFLDLETEKFKAEQKVSKDLNKKATTGKIMTIVGGVGIGVGLAGILYGVLK